MIRFLCVFGIKIYQKFISPKKGFRCAHSVLHGGSGCSGAVIEIIQNNSIFDWRKLINKRFEDCKKASIKIKKRKSKCKVDPSDCLDGVECCID